MNSPWNVSLVFSLLAIIVVTPCSSHFRPMLRAFCQSVKITENQAFYDSGSWVCLSCL